MQVVLTLCQWLQRDYYGQEEFRDCLDVYSILRGSCRLPRDHRLEIVYRHFFPTDYRTFQDDDPILTMIPCTVFERKWSLGFIWNLLNGTLGKPYSFWDRARLKEPNSLGVAELAEGKDAIVGMRWRWQGDKDWGILIVGNTRFAMTPWESAQIWSHYVASLHTLSIVPPIPKDLEIKWLNVSLTQIDYIPNTGGEQFQLKL